MIILLAFDVNSIYTAIHGKQRLSLVEKMHTDPEPVRRTRADLRSDSQALEHWTARVEEDARRRVKNATTGYGCYPQSRLVELQYDL